MKSSLLIRPGQLSLKELIKDFYTPGKIKIDLNAKERVIASRKLVESYVKNNRIGYGINTGFGKLAHKIISNDKLRILQHNLVLSHAAGTGPFLSSRIVRLILILKINTLIQGYSGVRWEVIELLLKMVNSSITPLLPSKGSVGASGDLAPLAHLTCALIGEGTVLFDHKPMSAKKALEKIGSAPLVLEPKEGLALLNGTQVSTALLLEALFRTQPLFETQILAGALSLFATQSDLTPFDPRIQLLRRMKAQSDVAAILYFLLEKTIVAEKNDYSLVQDPYSLRCQPQVMGACLTQFRYVAENIANEVNAVTDNPLIFSEDNEILSGGNFHAQWIGLGADAMACALATMANISERRIALFMDPNLSRLPAFLVNDSGENSGFMLAHVTAAALASENKVLAHPASVDTIPTSSNQEDHVSMATFAARRLQEIIENTTTVIAIELLCAAQGVDFHQDMNLPERIKPVYETIRRSIPFHEKDRYMAEAIAQLKSMVEKRDFRLLRGDCDFF